MARIAHPASESLLTRSNGAFRLTTFWLVLVTVWFECGTVHAAVPSPLDALLNEYRELGLPLPPKKARLVCYQSGRGTLVNRVMQQEWAKIRQKVKAALQRELDQ